MRLTPLGWSVLLVLVVLAFGASLTVLLRTTDAAHCSAVRGNIYLSSYYDCSHGGAK